VSDIALVVVSAVAALHVYILILEMFLWTGPIGRRSFGTSAEMATQTKSVAANQGLYNGFLAAGLIWGGLTDQGPVVLFFLICVTAAGLFGAFTVNRRIFFIQALPALIGIALLI
jgi:putative membrane protein